MDARLDTGGSAVTVLTIDATGPSQLVAYGSNGSRIYRNATYDVYHDVDPADRGRTTVEYVATEFDETGRTCRASACVRNVVERVNLTTGAVTRLYSRVSPAVGSSQTHDVDRVNRSVLLVGDIGPPDRVYMVNITTNKIIWEWRVDSVYTRASGGQYPGDWTHLNDVEYLPNGRVMVSLRNMDQVVFIDPGRGIVNNWTLGADDNRTVLYEQHNPDYIPRRNGGPAVLVADSENNRIVEYQRVNETWQRSWYWRDARLQWPRDADRLPNGNTIIVDSHGNRLFAVAPDGEIVWREILPDGGYDVEVLGTGEESAGGESADRLDYVDRRLTPAYGVVRWTIARVIDLMPSVVFHGLLFVLPGWVSPFGAVSVLFQILIAISWLTTEAVTAVGLGPLAPE